jgi:hypothetical protein
MPDYNILRICIIGIILYFGIPADQEVTWMPNAILIGKEETFRTLGIRVNRQIKLESLIARLRKQLKKEFHDTKDVGKEILQGLQAVKEGKIDRRHWKSSG